MAFTDLKELRKNMEKNEIAVFSTAYAYNNTNCYIAFCLLTSEDKVKEKRKAEIEAKKEAIRQEDIAKGVFVPVSMLPAAEPKKGVANA